MSIKIKVYLSDDGFGHLVRQESVIKRLLQLNPDLDITIQNKNKIDVAKQKFGDTVKYIERFNNIETLKLVTGYLDVEGTRTFFENYSENSRKFIELENKEFDYDMVISDTVAEAHEVARINNVPSFTTFHFEWSWFCDKTFPDLTKTSDLMKKYYQSATKIYMPPFTPAEIEEKYQANSMHVPFIINSFEDIELPKTNKINVLIMDNGTSTLSELIIRNFSAFSSLKQCHFFIPKNLAKNDGPNITRIEGLKNIHSHIPKVDVIIARAGYNTITESLITKVPLLLVNEGNNPEVKHNIDSVCGSGLGGSMTVDEYRENFSEVFEDFILNKYSTVKQNLNSANFISNGALVVAKDILKEYEEWQK